MLRTQEFASGSQAELTLDANVLYMSLVLVFGSQILQNVLMAPKRFRIPLVGKLLDIK